MPHSAPGVTSQDQNAFSSKTQEIVKNLLVALTVSFIALSLGAAFGVLSGRGAFIGMFSAGVIAIITGLLGGTRVQCSGPVAPMAAIMAVVFTTMNAQYTADASVFGGMTPDHFLNLVCFLCGGFLLLMAVLRTGFLISYVPDPVISGFMTGISLIIWKGQAELFFGIGQPGLMGSMLQNGLAVILTLVVIVGTAPVLRRFSHQLARIVPGTLVAILLVTVFAVAADMNVQKVSVGTTIPNWQGLVDLVKAQWPQNMSWAMTWKAAPISLEFALICYLDSLMVALVIDRMRGEKTKQNKELMAQGVANAAVGLIGGVMGTQSSIRSVMINKEGATMRMAGTMVGVFIIIQMLLFQHWLILIPQAVFMGVLIRVGWNVCDREPIWKFITRKIDRPSVLDFVTIIGTALVTVYSLTLAVAFFTVFYYVVAKYAKIAIVKNGPIEQEERYIRHVMGKEATEDLAASIEADYAAAEADKTDKK